MADLKFKYGEGDVPTATAAGTVYIKKTVDGKAQMFVDEPVEDGSTPDRLQIGGEIFIGDPDDAGKDYEVVIDPNGTFIDNIVTSAETGGYIIRVVSTSNPDSYDPSLENFSRNTIVLVVEQ